MVARPFLERLADWICTPSTIGLDGEVGYWAKQAFLDYLGVALLGAGSPEGEVVRRWLTADGQWDAAGAPVIGLGANARPTAAAFANGSLGHLHDFDDLSDHMVGHPTVVTLPAVLAAARGAQRTGRDLLEAYLVAFEVAAKLGLSFNWSHSEKGWHPTATLGVFGAAAGVCRLLRLDRRTTTAALGVAAAFASGFKASFGTLAKPLQVGRASQSGLQAVQLAVAGADARPDAVEHHQGFAALFNGAGTFDLDAIDGRLGNPWEMVDPGVALKLYPSCGGTHSAIDCALLVRRDLGGSSAGVERVTVRMHPRRLVTVDRPEVVSRFDGKFSVQYTAALALHNGRVVVDDFLADHRIDPDVEALAARVEARPLPVERYGPEHFAAEVEVTTVDGRTVRRRVEKARGRGPRLAAGEDERMDKFRSCAQRAVTPALAERLATQVLALEELDTAELEVFLASLTGLPAPA